MFDRQSLVNVTLKIRAKFHSNRLVRYRNIVHTVSKNAFKVSERQFLYVSFTYFFYLYISPLTVLLYYICIHKLITFVTLLHLITPQ